MNTTFDANTHTIVDGLNKELEQENQRIRAKVGQVAHDIMSPITAQRMILARLNDIPEKQRVALYQATIQIEDIINDLVRQFKHQEQDELPEAGSSPVFAYMEVSAVLSEKRIEYGDKPVTFTHKIDPKAYFAFFEANRRDWLRMMSNIVNNSVDALEGKPGAVELSLYLDGSDVVTVVSDNGKGMSAAVRDKILEGVSVTDGKDNGHGIGMIQVFDTLQENNGKLDIISSPNAGTKMIITFPRTATPKWAATELSIGADQDVLVLDDDQFIHGAWDTCFAPLLEKYPSMALKHFTKGRELQNYLRSLTPEAFQKVFLLSDYELISQPMNGIDIIAQHQLRNTILVTSHYADKEVVARASELGIPILPKRLSSKLPIRVQSAEGRVQ